MDRRSGALLAFCGCCWGSAFLWIEVASRSFNPVYIVAMRNVLAVAALLAWSRARGLRLAPGTVRSLVRRPVLALAAGAVGFTAPLLFVSQAEKDLPTGLVAVVVASAPLMLAFAAPWLVPEDRLGARGGVGLAVGILGIAAATGGETLAHPQRALPLLLVIGAAMMNAIYPVIVRRHYAGVPPIAIVVHAACGGIVVSGLMMPFVPAPDHVSAESALAVVALSIICTAVPFTVYAGLVARVGAVKAAAANYLIPFTGVVLGVLVLGERLRFTAAAGLLAILGGVYLTSTSGRAQSTLAAEAVEAVPEPQAVAVAVAAAAPDAVDPAASDDAVHT
jgi:drug/metabolite transporter (DMT)-like permease